MAQQPSTQLTDAQAWDRHVAAGLAWAAQVDREQRLELLLDEARLGWALAFVLALAPLGALAFWLTPWAALLALPALLACRAGNRRSARRITAEQAALGPQPR